MQAVCYTYVRSTLYIFDVVIFGVMSLRHNVSSALCSVTGRSVAVDRRCAPTSLQVERIEFYKVVNKLSFIYIDLFVHYTCVCL